MTGKRGKDKLDAEAVAKETLAEICRQGFLDCKRTPPCHSMRDLADIELLIQGAIFRAMTRTRECCALLLESTLDRMPEGIPDFVAAQAEETMRSLANSIRAVPIWPVQVAPYSTVPPEPPGSESEGSLKPKWPEPSPKLQQKLAEMSSFECQWCMEAGLPKEEYTKKGAVPAGADFYHRPLCTECVERCEPPPKRKEEGA